MIKSLLLISFVLLISCGQETDYEELTSTTSEVLTRENHPYGWGREDCFSCHIKNNIHRYNKLDKSDRFMDDARASNSWYGGDGNFACMTCHGGVPNQNNGIE